MIKDFSLLSFSKYFSKLNFFYSNAICINRPLSKMISINSRKHNIEELKIETQNTKYNNNC